MVTNSPREMLTCTPARAWVSTASVRKTFFTPSIRISVLSLMVYLDVRPLLESQSIVIFPAVRIGNDDAVPLGQAL
jgi:hypothetical protein